MTAVLEISAERFRANLAAVQGRIAPSELLLAMKDDAYGHGLDWAATTAADAGIGWFGGYDIETALRIRRAVGDRGRIFAWATSEDAEVADALRAGIDLGVGTVEYLARVIEVAQRCSIAARVHLKIDTGLHRNGIRPEHWGDAVGIALAAQNAGWIRLVGVWSHIAEASDADDDEAQAVFLAAVAAVEAAGGDLEVRHLTASAAAWWRPELRGNLSRIGAFCYGIRSADGPELEGVRPVATLTAPVTGVEESSAGITVRIGVGSLDGIPSTLVGAPAGAPAGRTIIRAIEHTETVLDGWPGAAVGDLVRLFGPGAHGEPSATDLAERIDTVGEEILTRLSPRIRRVYG